MRSTRHKLKTLRGVSRSNANGSGGIPYRKHIHYQHPANFHRHSSTDNATANNSHLTSLNHSTNSRPRSKPYNQHPPAYLSPSSALQPISNGNHTTNNQNPPRRTQNLAWVDIHSTAMDLNSEIRAKAFAICKDYLHGAWKQIDARDLTVKRIR